jgi:hypothetical protein
MKDLIKNTVDGKEITHLYGKRDIKWEGTEPSCFDGKRYWYFEEIVKEGVSVTYCNGRHGYEHVFNVTFHYNGLGGISFELHRFEKEGGKNAAYGFFCRIKNAEKLPS